MRIGLGGGYAGFIPGASGGLQFYFGQAGYQVPLSTIKGKGKIVAQDTAAVQSPNVKKMVQVFRID